MTGQRVSLRKLGEVALIAILPMLVACSSAAPSKPSASPPGANICPHDATARKQTVQSGGQKRSYFVLRPSTLPADRIAPLVVALHGFGDGASGMERSTGLDGEATRAGFVVVYPEGLLSDFKKIGLSTSGFNAAPELFGDSGVDDVGFIAQVMDRVQKACGTNPNAVFVTGLSGGAMMAYRVACELSDRVAAIAPVSGPMAVTCSAARPVSVLHLHGTADDVIPVAGGSTERFGVLPPVAIGLARWREVDGCPAAATSESVPAGVVAAGSALKQTWGPCTGGSEVVFYQIANGAHSWPVGATKVIVNFFAAHQSLSA